MEFFLGGNLHTKLCMRRKNKKIIFHYSEQYQETTEENMFALFYTLQYITYFDVCVVRQKILMILKKNEIK